VVEEEAERAGYAQYWRLGSGGDLRLGVLDGRAIAQPEALDELAETVGAVEPMPVALGRLGEVETRKDRVPRRGVAGGGHQRFSGKVGL